MNSFGPPCDGADGMNGASFAVYTVGDGPCPDGVCGITGRTGCAVGRRTGIPFYRDTVLLIPAIYKPHVGNALQVGVVDAEYVSRSGCGPIAGKRPGVAQMPEGPTGGEQCRTPGITRGIIPRLPVTPADKCGTPRIAFAQSAITEVLRNPAAVVPARNFADANFLAVNFLQRIASVSCRILTAYS